LVVARDDDLQHAELFVAEARDLLLDDLVESGELDARRMLGEAY
jgi:hypothetical protein